MIVVAVAVTEYLVDGKHKAVVNFQVSLDNPTGKDDTRQLTLFEAHLQALVEEAAAQAVTDFGMELCTDGPEQWETAARKAARKRYEVGGILPGLSK